MLISMRVELAPEAFSGDDGCDMIILGYITRSIVLPFAALLVVLGLITSVMQLSRLGEVAFGALGDVTAFARLSLYVAPTLAGVALPIALLLACLIAYDRLSDSGEIFALATSGVSSRRLFSTTAVVALPVALLSLWLNLVAVPWGIRNFLDEMAGLATRAFSQALTPGAFSELLGSTALYAAQVDTDPGRWRQVFLFHQPAGVDRQILVLAPEIRVRPEAHQRAAVLEIDDGESLVISPNHSLEQVHFDRGEARLDLERWTRRETSIYYRYQAHGLFALLDDLAAETRPRDRHKIAFFMWQKLSLPFACFPLALLGALLGTGRSPERRARSYVWGVMIAVLFFVGHEGARGLAVDGTLSPLSASWLAVALSCLAAALLWRQRAGLRS